MKILTYNVGHGFYAGDYIKGQKLNKKIILNNINETINLIKKIDADVVLLQETHKKGVFPYNSNYNNMLCKSNYNNLYLSNRKALLINIGNSILINSSDYELKKISLNQKLSGLKNNFFCQNKNYMKMFLNKYVIYNIHLSPYKKNELVRNQQLNYLLKDALLEINNGYKIVIGGDFNMNIRNGISDLPVDFKLIISKENTNRSLNNCANNTSHSTIDGFIVSKDIKVNSIISLNNYDYSDHSPVILEID